MPDRRLNLTLEDVLRDIIDRLEGLEERTEVIVGSWTLRQRVSDGALIATNIRTGATTVIAP